MRTYMRKKPQVQEIEDVQSLCRLCLGKSEQMVSIFEINVDDIFFNLAMRIAMCLGLEVSKDDVFPKFICQVCNAELEKFYSFKKKCTATYQKLKASLVRVKETNNKKGDSEVNEKQPTDTITLDCSDSNIITADSSDNLAQIYAPLELPLSDTVLPEKHVQRGTISVIDVKQMQAASAPPLITTNKDCHQSPTRDVATETSIDNFPSTSTLDIFSDHDQMGVGNIVLHVDKRQPVENKETTDNIKNPQYLPAAIVKSLIEKGVLATRNDALEILDPSVNTFALETSCGNEVVLELVEEDPYVADTESDNPSSTNFDFNLKSDARCCGRCGARFPGRGALQRHMRVHSGERPFACRACGRRFAQREVLRRHELLHADKLPYQCPHCPKAYTQRGALEAHARTHAPPSARPIVMLRCSRCPKIFLYPSGLSRHMNVHQGRDYPCDECSRKFNDTSSLQRHRRAHHRRGR